MKHCVVFDILGLNVCCFLCFIYRLTKPLITVVNFPVFQKEMSDFRYAICNRYLYFGAECINKSPTIFLFSDSSKVYFPFYYQVSCSGGQRGIYLRESHQLCKPTSEAVSVTTNYEDDVGM